MSLVEDHSRVAVVEMLSVLRRASEHCGPEFQTTSKAIKQTLVERFGVSFARNSAGRELLQHVIDTLVEREVLEVWDTRTRNKAKITVYQVNTFALFTPC